MMLKLPWIYARYAALPNSIFVRRHSSTHYDVIVSGGGLVGGTIACALGSSPYFSGKRVLLLESQTQKPMEKSNPMHPFSSRVCAMSPGSKRLMERLGFWSSIKRKGTVKKMQIWDALSESSISFDEDNMNGDLCYIIENDLMVSSIHEVLGKMEPHRLEVLYGSRISTLDLPKDYGITGNQPIRNAHITLDSGKNLECSLLIAADGANSAIPEKAGVPKLSWKYDQSAVVATLKLDKSTENVVAWQRFLPQGPIALLPLDDKHSSLVWSTSHLRAKELMAMSEEHVLMSGEPSTTVEDAEGQFKRFLARIFPNPKVDQLQIPPLIAGICSKLASFPLGVSHSNYYVKPRLALIGDVAHRIHPLAGQGANLGFRDVQCLLECLEQALEKGSDLGCMSHLVEFERQRQLDNWTFCMATDGINRLYSTASEPSVLLRSLGLMGVSAIEPVKEFLKKQAMK